MTGPATPARHFELSFSRPEHLRLAGGIGITPLIGMADRLAEAGRPFRLLHAASTRAQLALGDALERRHGDRSMPVCSAAGERVDFGRAFDGLDADAECCFCGPQGVREAAQAARAEQSARRGCCASRRSRPAGGSRPSRSRCASATTDPRSHRDRQGFSG